MFLLGIYKKRQKTKQKIHDQFYRRILLRLSIYTQQLYDCRKNSPLRLTRRNHTTYTHITFCPWIQLSKTLPFISNIHLLHTKRNCCYLRYICNQQEDEKHVNFLSKDRNKHVGNPINSFTLYKTPLNLLVFERNRILKLPRC